jgi:probable HAF family extracellular repeat protein
MVPYFSLFRFLRSSRRGPSRLRAGQPRRAPAPPRVEPLEDRWLLSTILDLGPNVAPKAINASGQVVGDVVNGSQTHAFLYSNGSLADLGTVGGFTNSHANALNDNGKVVGSLDNGTGSVQHALLYNSQNGNLTDRGTALVVTHIFGGLAVTFESQGVRELVQHLPTHRRNRLMPNRLRRCV